jgi:hypothetical protein
VRCRNKARRALSRAAADPARLRRGGHPFRSGPAIAAMIWLICW